MPATTCAKCGSSIPPDAPNWSCPGCLFGIAAEPFADHSEASSESALRERRLGDYMLQRQLGSGGMGIVYEALQVSLNRKVALKFIRDSQFASPMQLRRFTVEAEAAARLDHPNIVGVHEIGEIDGEPYISMDLVEGASLRALIGQGEFKIQSGSGPKPSRRDCMVAIARLISKLARALHHAHQRGVLHRDLKPANIILDERGEPHLTDFGLAKILRESTDKDAGLDLSSTGQIAGTLGYMSPEQASGADVSAASDVYGLGSVFYELLTRQPPFRESTPLETLKRIQDTPPKKPCSINRLIDRDLETICLRSLEKDPRHRFSSAEAFAEDLENWIERRPIKAHPTGPAIRTVRWMRRNPTATSLMAVLFLGLSSALILLAAVDQQRRKFEEQQALLSHERNGQLEKDWADPGNSSLRIFSKDLAIFDNRSPVDDPAARQLWLGVTVSGSPVSYATRLTQTFADLEATIGKAIGQTVQLNLLALKSDKTGIETLAQGDVHIIVMEATDYLRLKKTIPQIRVFAQFDSDEQGVMAANLQSGITNTQGLAGKAIAFPASHHPLTVWAKARFLDAGIARKGIRFTTNLVADTPSSSRKISREIVGLVLKGMVDAGATSLRKYDLEMQRELVLLDKFASTPRVFVAGKDLDQKTIEAFQTALVDIRKRSLMNRRATGAFDWDETFPGAIPINDTHLEGLREAMRKAARFDGEPDPFPPGPNVSARPTP